MARCEYGETFYCHVSVSVAMEGFEGFGGEFTWKLCQWQCVAVEVCEHGGRYFADAVGSGLVAQHCGEHQFVVPG